MRKLLKRILLVAVTQHIQVAKKHEKGQPSVSVDWQERG